MMLGVNCKTESICDRLKQRFRKYQDDWQGLVNDDNQEKESRDFEFIQYIVNFIIEQAKHNIVISELPDLIKILHRETENILRKNRMVTLQQIIFQVQSIGAQKYPYLKKIKPITVEDFVREVLREVFDRLGTIITLDMIENICQLTTCSARQLLQAMPDIDVSDAATLVIEDISRNQLHKRSKPIVASDFESANIPISRPEQSFNKNANSQSNFLPFHHSLLTNTHQYKQQLHPATAHHYTKHSHQHLDTTDNDRRTKEIDAESCPLEHILNHRFLDKLEYFT